MTVERVVNSGAIIVSDFVGEGAGEYLLTRTYYGYTMAEAKARFKAETREEAEEAVKKAG